MWSSLDLTFVQKSALFADVILGLVFSLVLRAVLLDYKGDTLWMILLPVERFGLAMLGLDATIMVVVAVVALISPAFGLILTLVGFVGVFSVIGWSVTARLLKPPKPGGKDLSVRVANAACLAILLLVINIPALVW